MIDGQLGALLAAPDADHVVLEVDEPRLGVVAGQVRPEVLVLLNLSRDQLDRMGEIRTVCESLRKAVAENPQATVVANVDDPAIVHAASAASRVVWVSARSSWREDHICPRCGAAIDLGVRSWSCDCGFVRPQPDWLVAGMDALGPHGKVSLRLRLPGAVNRANAVMAIAAAEALGCPASRAAAAVADLEQISGRYREFPVAGRQARLLLAKNPAGWTEMLGMLGDRPIVLVVNNREADGADVSWLWDVPFERLGRRRVVVAGDRAVDLAVRLRYAEVDHSMVRDPVTAIGSTVGNPDVLATYTAFRDLAWSAA
jgi:lipid II isoglutaminyl synthase (glutamine-hydrolysing)